MIRRNARLRKEYLYRKSLEGKARETYEKKRQIKEALQEGKPVPTELREEAFGVMKEMEFDDAKTGDQPKTHVDDEYALAGIKDPKVVITTSRNPTSRLGQFAKELKLVIPNSQRINRGNTVVKELISSCRSAGVSDVLIVHEHRGEPDGLVVCHLPYGPTAYFTLSNCVLRHDIKDQQVTPMSEVYPHLVFDNFDTKLGKRTKDILRYLFPTPKPENKRVITFSNQNDFVSFRHHTFTKDKTQKGAKSVELKEMGPRFEMRLFHIKLGTLEMKDADTEWVLRPYMNTASKRKAL